MMILSDTTEFYYIVWRDVADKDPSWSTKEEIEIWDENNFEVEQIGFLVKETDDYILISSQIGVFYGEINYGNLTKIPKGMISFMNKIELKKYQ